MLYFKDNEIKIYNFKLRYKCLGIISEFKIHAKKINIFIYVFISDIIIVYKN